MRTIALALFLSFVFWGCTIDCDIKCSNGVHAWKDDISRSECRDKAQEIEDQMSTSCDASW